MITEAAGRDWRTAALCAQTDPEIFYAIDTGAAGELTVARAKRVCAGCPVRTECLADVMAAEDPAERWGVTGGLSADERTALYFAEHRPAPASVPVAVALTAPLQLGLWEPAGRCSGMTTPRSAVKTTLTAGRLRRVVENDEFTAFSRRILRAAGRRVAAGDIDGLPELVALGAAVETVITDAIGALHGAGYSWAEIASRLDITRQAAHQRWAAITAGVSTSEGMIR